jgi:hypothetical protein
MKLKQLIIKSIVLLLLPLLGRSQYLEIGIAGGGSNFIGDVGPYSLDVPQGYHAGFLMRYNFNRHWSFRAQANYGLIQADDDRSNMSIRNERNLSFRSEIREAYVVAEFNFFQYQPGTKLWHTPYINGGFGLFSFNPEAKIDGEWYELRPLKTEGQGTSVGAGAPYANASSFFIFSLGYKFALGSYTSLAIETSFRSTYTDYLDDVSGFYANPAVLENEVSPLSATLADRSFSGSDKENILRGDPSNQDWYIFTGISIQFKFGELYEKCANFVGN